MANILIIDDETSNLKVLSTEFKAEHQVLLAKSPVKGLQTAIDNAPDLILLDVIMPEMDGFAVIEKLKENPNTANIPVIFITGLDTTENEEYGLQLGAVDYIYKPFHLPIVRKRVETHLRMVELERELAELKA